jgi:hypothetical protein
MDLRRLGQHTVQVEKASAHVIGETKHASDNTSTDSLSIGLYRKFTLCYLNRVIYTGPGCDPVGLRDPGQEFGGLLLAPCPMIIS